MSEIGKIIQANNFVIPELGRSTSDNDLERTNYLRSSRLVCQGLANVISGVIVTGSVGSISEAQQEPALAGGFLGIVAIGSIQIGLAFADRLRPSY